MASLSPLSAKKSSLPTTRSRSPALEVDYVRLQRTADTVSIQFEQECRRDVLLNEQIRMFEEELRRKKESMLAPVDVDSEDKKLRQKAAALSHELHLTSVSVAETQTRNRALRLKIEGCRRDLANCKYAIRTLTTDIEQASRVATHLNAVNCAKTLADVRDRGFIQQVRSRSVNTRVKQDRKLQELKVICSQTAFKEEFEDRNNTFVTAIGEEIATPARRAYDLMDPIPIQRALLQKWHEVLDN